MRIRTSLIVQAMADYNDMQRKMQGFSEEPLEHVLHGSATCRY